MAGPSASPGLRAAMALAITAAATAAVMLGLGPAGYLWVKAIHVVAIIAWMAGMLYLPRLFVYHADAAPGSELAATLEVMERRLLTIIINPAMVMAWVLGLWLAWKGGHFGSAWFQAKLAFVMVLSAVHGYFSAAVRRFRDGDNVVSARGWRMWNEVPTVLMIAIVILVIVKPF